VRVFAKMCESVASYSVYLTIVYVILTGGFFGFFMYVLIQHCFIYRPSDSTVSEDAGTKPRTVATSALIVRGSSHSATSHPHTFNSEKKSTCPSVSFCNYLFRYMAHKCFIACDATVRPHVG
jgi:hypothetical protein